MKKVLVACLVGFLVGCSSSTVTPAPIEPKLKELRQHFGLPDCPETERKAKAVVGGLPQTQIRCLGSDRLVNLAGLEKKPTIVMYWAQWCIPCREEAPVIAAAFKQHPEIQFLGMLSNETRSELALEMADLVGWKFPQLNPVKEQLTGEIEVPGQPYFLFVDSKGRIVYRHAGGMKSLEQLEELIKKYL